MTDGPHRGEVIRFSGRTARSRGISALDRPRRGRAGRVRQIRQNPQERKTSGDVNQFTFVFAGA
jgi:hypothetical protein